MLQTCCGSGAVSEYQRLVYLSNFVRHVKLVQSNECHFFFYQKLIVILKGVPISKSTVEKRTEPPPTEKVKSRTIRLWLKL